MSAAKLHLIYGEENFFLTQAVRELRTKYVDPTLEAFALEIIPAQERNIDHLINAMQMLSGFCASRLVLAYDPFFLIGGKKNKAAEELTETENPAGKSAGLTADAEKLLYSALENIPEGVVVAFVVNGLPDQRCKMFKFLQKQAEIRRFDAFNQWDKGKVADWLRDYLRPKNIAIDAAAADFLVEVSGVSVGALVNEVEKILTYAAGQNRLTIQDVQAVASQGELNVYALGEALQRRDVPAALDLTMALLKDGEAPQMLLGLAAARIKLLLQLKELQAQRQSYQEMASLLKRSPFYIKRILTYDLPRHDAARLKSVYYDLQNADYQMKTGQLEAKNALICALAGLA